MDFFTEIIREIKKESSKDKIQKLKVRLSKKYKLKKIPTDIEILMNVSEKDIPKIKKTLQTKESRTISGVSPVAVMTKPFPCPHGKCAYCPGGPKSEFGDVPQSYTGHEPATMRAIRSDYDPYLQVFNRLEQYIIMGHNVDKIELIIMGGTFPSIDKKYQEEFVMYCFKAMNDFSDLFFKKEFDLKKFKEFFELPHGIGNKETTEKIKKKILKIKKISELKKEQKRNEDSKVKCIGLTIETRPDWGFLKHGNEMLRLGCTRVELGIQSLNNKILKTIERGHTIEDTKKSIRILKDLGFKLNFHIMLGLPGTTKKEDIETFKKLFTEEYQPDMLKIYPCMVSKGTKLYDWMKKGNYKPISTEEAAERIAEGKRFVQRYCRIMRVQRDIPPEFMEGGVKKSNLRQYVAILTKEKNIKCQCIRCRESGRNKDNSKVNYDTIKYESSKAKEYFISANTEEDAIVGFIRMRYPSQILRKEITKNSALIRELHVYGAETPIGKKGEQHKGIGRKLLNLAEKQAKKDKKNKMIIISGIGVRNYYKKLGYDLEGPYMVKFI